MNKKKYVTLKLDIQYFKATDVITASLTTRDVFNEGDYYGDEHVFSTQQ